MKKSLVFSIALVMTIGIVVFLTMKSHTSELEFVANQTGLSIPEDVVIEHVHEIHAFTSRIAFIKLRLQYATWLKIISKEPLDLVPGDNTASDPFSYYLNNNPFDRFISKFKINPNDIPSWWTPDNQKGIGGPYNVAKKGHSGLYFFSRRSDGDVDAWFMIFES